MRLPLTRLNNKLCYYMRSADNDYVTLALDDLLKIEEREVPFYSVLATKKLVFRKEYTRKLQCDEYYVYLPIPMIELLNYRLQEYDVTLELDSSDSVDLSISSELENELSHIYGEHSDKLLELLRFLSAHPNGLVDLYTGFGKSWSLIGLAKIFLTNNSGDVMIIASGSQVVNEINSRIPLFNLDQSRLLVVNSASLRAKRFYTDSFNSRKDQIKFIIVDECDSIFNTLRDYLDSANGYSNIIGFTATSDHHEGQVLNFDLDFKKLRTDTYRILAYIGHEIITAIPTANINLNVVNSNFSNRKPYMESEFLKFKQAVQYVVDSDKFIDLLAYIQKYQKDTVYLPINNKNLINKVLSRAKRRRPDLKFIYWDASEIWTTDGIVFKNHIELNSYLLSHNSKNRANIIISTRASYRGVSLPSLTDIILVENSNFRNVPQSIGRTMRSELPTIWIPRETSQNNALFMAMANKRLRIINQTYPNLNRKVIDF